MPLASVKFAPGFDKQSTEYGAEGKWIDGENIRFRYGQPENYIYTLKVRLLILHLFVVLIVITILQTV